MNRILFRLFLPTAMISLPMFGCNDHCPVNPDDCVTETVIGGVDDNFAQGNSEPLFFTDDFLDFGRNWLDLRSTMNVQTYDQRRSDLAFSTVLKLPGAEDGIWEEIESARLTIRLRCLGGISDNDAFSLNGRDADGKPYNLWSTWISFLHNGTWNGGDEITVVLDLKNMPSGSHPGRYPSNVLAGLRNGELFIIVEDDTAVDFIKLEASTCPDTRGA